MEIRVLARQGRSIKAIARELGLSRNTVRKYLRKHARASYKPRAGRPTKLEPHKVDLAERIEAARSHGIPATVLLRELQSRGYDGGITRLKASGHRTAAHADTATTHVSEGAHFR